MSNARCDHYWLSRRGGKCPFCADVFPGNARPSKYEVARRIGREPSQSELVAEANKPNLTEPRELIRIGDVAVCDGMPPRGNPYQQGLLGDERVAALRRFMLGGNTNGLTLWYAPVNGGARGIGSCEVDWATSGLGSSPAQEAETLRKAFDEAVEAMGQGFPVKAQRILQDTQKGTPQIFKETFCPGPGPVHKLGTRHLCRDCTRSGTKRVYEDAMNH